MSKKPFPTSIIYGHDQRVSMLTGVLHDSENSPKFQMGDETSIEWMNVLKKKPGHRKSLSAQI
jgi:hypothetical protein